MNHVISRINSSEPTCDNHPIPDFPRRCCCRRPEFLVTGPDGAILERTILGDSLLIAPAEAGTPKDKNQVFYFDLPRSAP